MLRFFPALRNSAAAHRWQTGADLALPDTMQVSEALSRPAPACLNVRHHVARRQALARPLLHAQRCALTCAKAASVESAVKVGPAGRHGLRWGCMAHRARSIEQAGCRPGECAAAGGRSDHSRTLTRSPARALQAGNGAAPPLELSELTALGPLDGCANPAAPATLL